MLKIIVLGPESTGKSTLCAQLAEHFHSNWCPEFARQYLLQHGMNYTYDDLLTIAEGQNNLEDEHEQLAQQNDRKLFFIDTNMYVMKVWCEFVFQKCHPYILNEIVSRNYDLYLLCNTDLPWVKDELREYPDPQTRNQLYSIYLDHMMNQATPWVIISGNYEERLGTAIEAVDNLLKKNLG